VHEFMGELVAQGLSVIIPGVMLTVVGFPESAKPGQVDPQVLTSLAYIYVPVVYFAVLAMAGMLVFYRISQEAHERNLAKLREATATAEAIVESDPLPTPAGTVGVQSRPV